MSSPENQGPCPSYPARFRFDLPLAVRWHVPGLLSLCPSWRPLHGLRRQVYLGGERWSSPQAVSWAKSSFVRWVASHLKLSLANVLILAYAEETWKGFQVLPSDLVDFLITQCDGTYWPETGIQVKTWAGVEASHNPFSVFPATPVSVAEGGRIVASKPKPEEGPLRSLSLTSNTSKQEHYLFQYYLERIGALMLPYEHSNNPWKSIYPAAATASRRSADRSILYHALLAHAAFHLAQVKVGDTAVHEAGPRYYNIAIAQLLDTMRKEDGLTPVTLVSILSLMYAEVRQK